MWMHRASGSVLLSILVLGAGGAGAGSPISIENAHLDLGEVIAGSTVSATFVLHNSGSSPVRILRAAPS